MSVGHSSDSHCIGFSEPPGVFLDYNNSMLGEGTKKALFRSLLLFKLHRLEESTMFYMRFVIHRTNMFSEHCSPQSKVCFF